MFQVKKEKIVEDFTVDETPTDSSKFAVEAAGNTEKDARYSEELATIISVLESSWLWGSGCSLILGGQGQALEHGWNLKVFLFLEMLMFLLICQAYLVLMYPQSFQSYHSHIV